MQSRARFLFSFSSFSSCFIFSLHLIFYYYYFFTFSVCFSFFQEPSLLLFYVSLSIYDKSVNYERAHTTHVFVVLNFFVSMQLDENRWSSAFTCKCERKKRIKERFIHTMGMERKEIDIFLVCIHGVWMNDIGHAYMIYVNRSTVKSMCELVLVWMLFLIACRCCCFPFEVTAKTWIWMRMILWVCVCIYVFVVA